MDFSYSNAERRCEIEAAEYTIVNYKLAERPLIDSVKNRLTASDVEFKNLEPSAEAKIGNYCLKIAGAYGAEDITDLGASVMTVFYKNEGGKETPYTRIDYNANEWSLLGDAKNELWWRAVEYKNLTATQEGFEFCTEIEGVFTRQDIEELAGAYNAWQAEILPLSLHDRDIKAKEKIEQLNELKAAKAERAA